MFDKLENTDQLYTVDQFETILLLFAFSGFEQIKKFILLLKYF